MDQQYYNIRLDKRGEEILRKGGHDDASDDDMVIMEIVKRAPGMNADELQRKFVELRLLFGDELLRAIQRGDVYFELQESAK